VSELAWGQTDKVEDVLQIGQQVEVAVKSLDWERERISLSLKETMPNPWDDVAEKYPAGSTHQGTISRLATFGAFVTLEPGIDGLLHISKLGSGRRINHPREVVEEGQELTVKIDAIDEKQQRISLVPDDYVKREAKEKEDKQQEKETLRSLKTSSQSMGTLGDLLQAQIKKK
jgi:small subunit ribosomal protein S1